MYALLSIMTLYNADNTIFDNFKVPVGVDKDIVVNNLLLELAEIEVLYTSPAMMKFAIGVWSEKELSVWSKLFDTTQFDYNPLENLSRREEHSETESRQLTKNGTETRNLAGSNGSTASETSSDSSIRTLDGTRSETRNLAGTTSVTDDLDSATMETRNLASTGSLTGESVSSNLETRNLAGSSTSGSDGATSTVNSGTDTNKHYVVGFNTSTQSLASVDEALLGTSVTGTSSMDVSGNTTDTGTITTGQTIGNTSNTTGTDSGTVGTDSSQHNTSVGASTDTGTVLNSIGDDETINNNGTNNMSLEALSTDTGTIANVANDSESVTRTNTMYARGSIGVITNQDMVQQERKVVQFNINNYIISSFKSRFCLLIY